MTLVDLPYVQRLAVFWLLTQEEIDAQVVTDLPHDIEAGDVAMTGAWVEIHGFAGRIHEAGSIYWAEDSGLQVNCFAGKRHATFELAQIVRRVFVERFIGVIETDFDAAAVAHVKAGGIHPDVDNRFEGRTVHRARFDLLVTAHPTISGS